MDWPRQESQGTRRSQKIDSKGKKLKRKGTRRQRAPCEGVANIENEEKTSNRSLLSIDTLTQDKLYEITWRTNQEKCKPDVIALVKANRKILAQNTIQHGIKSNTLTKNKKN